MRTKPSLTQKHKALRLAWCLNNLNTDFRRYVFSDETTVRQFEVPFYHSRKISSNPEGIEATKKYGFKLNVYGSISSLGPSAFYVIK